jgi:hypothetical protein
MIGPGTELDHIRGVLAEARRVRDTAASGDAIDPQTAPLLLKSLSELIQVSESLIAQREQMESRLHRTPFPPPPAMEFGDRP